MSWIIAYQIEEDQLSAIIFYFTDILFCFSELSASEVNFAR